MAMRKPYQPGMEAAGDTGMPGAPMPMQGGRVNAQPPMPMGGNPGQQNGQPAIGAIGAIGMNGRPSLTAGGPTAPGNIGNMLQPQVGSAMAQPPQQPQSVPLPAWGDQGTPAAPMGASANGGVSRVPYEPQLPDALVDGGAGMQPGVVMQLMRKLGRI